MRYDTRLVVEPSPTYRIQILAAFGKTILTELSFYQIAVNWDRAFIGITYFFFSIAVHAGVSTASILTAVV